MPLPSAAARDAHARSERQPLARADGHHDSAPNSPEYFRPRPQSRSRASSAASVMSNTSFVFDGIDRAVREEMRGEGGGRAYYDHPPTSTGAGGAARGAKYSKERKGRDGSPDLEGLDGHAHRGPAQPPDRRFSRWVWALVAVCLLGWGAAIVLFVTTGSSMSAPSPAHPLTPSIPGHVSVELGNKHGKEISLKEVITNAWRPVSKRISWIAGANGEDGLLLERNLNSAATDTPFLLVRDVHAYGGAETNSSGDIVLMEHSRFVFGDETITVSGVWPSPDLKKVLIVSDKEDNWRYSFTGRYWIFDVASQTAEPLDPEHSSGLSSRVQLATWSPMSDAIAFTRFSDMNMYIRMLDESKTRQITTDGNADLFYGVPDWVYEEEVFATNVGTWWSPDGSRIAFLRTNETAVPTYPVQYFLSRPSGKDPLPGQENYPEVREIKYPKAGAPNPEVTVGIHDLASGTTTMEIPFKRADADFTDDDRLVTQVVWAGSDSVLVWETNRESDVLKVVHIDVHSKQADVVREQNVTALDGGWFEVTRTSTFVPADPSRGRHEDGYIDTIPVNGFDHLAYFSPVNSSEPAAILTFGSWEVVDAPSSVDLDRNVVYFIGTRDGSMNRHLYAVGLLPGKDGEVAEPVAATDIKENGYYDASFSSGSGYALLTYRGPGIPWQKIISAPAADGSAGSSKDAQFERIVEDNAALAERVKAYSFPTVTMGSIKIDGVEMNFVERRPANFDEKKKHPVLFYMYQGPGSQMVDYRWKVDFQTYVAATLGYVVVTVDGRGTGFKGRDFRCATRLRLGELEAHDQIAAAKEWSRRSYVDPNRMAIWGWSFGGFTTLKVLERDGGETFKYGIAVAPVTDWAFYDTIYTERYMRTPAHNPAGYANSTISDMDRLGKNVRFMVMHGVADDNVHMQSTLVLADKLNMAGISNYDMHMFPDSNHGIYFHRANEMVYTKLNDWLVNAFNGEWARLENPTPVPEKL